jgi:Ca2+-binding RTX toxin-like protein
VAAAAKPTAGNDAFAGTSRPDALAGLGGNDVLSAGSGNDLLLGGSGNDRLDGGKGADWMVGGSGNDTYVADKSGDRTVEASGQGTDTVRSSVSWTLAANVENLVLTGLGALAGSGNGAANALTGNAGANRLSGLGGNDRLTGGSGRDTFVFRPGGGTDVITDFADGQDRLGIGGFGKRFDSFAEIRAHASQAAADTVISLPSPSGAGATTIYLERFAVSRLDPTDFVFVAAG